MDRWPTSRAACSASPTRSSRRPVENAGVGFLVPIDLAKAVADKLVAGDPVEFAFLGVSTDPTSSSVVGDGAVVVDVTKDSPADKAGLQQGDKITSVDSSPVRDPVELGARVRSHQPGDIVTITFERDGNQADRTGDTGFHQVQVVRPPQPLRSLGAIPAGAEGPVVFAGRGRGSPGRPVGSAAVNVGTVVFVVVVLVIIGGAAVLIARRPRRGVELEPPAQPAAGPSTSTTVEAPPPEIDEATIAELEEALAEAPPEAPPEVVVKPSFRDRLGKARAVFGEYVGSVLVALARSTTRRGTTSKRR